MTIALSPSVSASFQFVAPQTRAMCSPRYPVYFFLDFSNIAIASKGVAVQQGDPAHQADYVRIHAGHLREFVEQDRIWRQGFAAACLNNPASGLEHNFREAEIEFRVYEKGRESGREQGIDEIIQCRMYQLLQRGKEPGVVVLATGDGNGHRRGEGFLPALEVLHDAGFRVEVMSWRHSFNSALKEWASFNGEAIELDDHFRELTFIKGVRGVEGVRHKYRKVRRTHCS